MKKKRTSEKTGRRTDVSLEKQLSSLWDAEVPDSGTAERLRARVMRAADSGPGTGSGPKNRRSLTSRLRIPAAACLLLAFGMSGLLLFREAKLPRIYTYTTGAGETVAFPESEPALNAASFAFDFPVVVRPLTKRESEGMFGTASVVRGGSPLANDDLVWRGGSDNGYGREDAPDFSNGIANDDLVWRDITVDWVDAGYRGELPCASGGKIIRTGQPDEPDETNEPDEPDKTHETDGEPADARSLRTDDLSADSALSDVWGTFREEDGLMLRAEGRLGDTKIAAAAPGIAGSDTALADGSGARGEVSRIDGVDVTFVRFTAAPDSRGERTVVLGASFPMTVTDESGAAAEWTVTAEQAGNADEPDAVARKLIESVKSILSASHEVVRNEEKGKE